MGFGTLNPISQAEIDALRVNFSLQFAEAYGKTPIWHTQMATVIPSTARSNVYGWAVSRLRLRQWIGPRTVQNLSEHEFTVKNLPFEATIELDMDDMSDDANTVGVFAAMDLPALADAAAKHPDQLLKEQLQANALSFDGLSFFNDAHPTFDDDGSTYDNDFALALTAENFNTVWAAMVSYLGEDGEPLGVMPNTLFVPPQLKRVALEIMQSTTYAQSSGAGAGNVAVDNVMRGWADVVVIPELSNEPTRWYVADTSKPIKPWIFQRREEARLIARDQLTDPKVFEEKKLTYGVDYRGAAAPSLPFLMARSTPVI